MSIGDSLGEPQMPLDNSLQLSENNNLKRPEVTVTDQGLIRITVGEGLEAKSKVFRIKELGSSQAEFEKTFQRNPDLVMRIVEKAANLLRDQTHAKALNQALTRQAISQGNSQPPDAPGQTQSTTIRLQLKASPQRADSPPAVEGDRSVIVLSGHLQANQIANDNGPVASTAQSVDKLVEDLKLFKEAGLTVKRGAVAEKGTVFEQLQHFIERRTEGKGYPPEVLKASLENLLERASFTVNKESMASKGQEEDEEKHVDEWNETTLGQLLQEPGNEALRSSLITLYRDQMIATSSISKPAKSKEIQKCTKDMRVFLLENLSRPPKQIQCETKAGVVKITQTYVKGAPVPYKDPTNSSILPNMLSQAYQSKKNGAPLELGTILPQHIFEMDKAHASLNDKGEIPAQEGMVGANTNLGIIMSEKPDKSKEVVCVRTGKSHNFERLVENSMMQAIAQLQCGDNAKGLKKREDGTLEFTSSISSFMDPSHAKSWDKWRGGESERDYLVSLMKGAQKWPQEGVSFTVNINNVDHKVILKKPLVEVLRFSGSVLQTKEITSGAQDAEKWSFLSHQAMVTEAMSTQKNNAFLLQLSQEDALMKEKMEAQGIIVPMKKMDLVFQEGVAETTVSVIDWAIMDTMTLSESQKLLEKPFLDSSLYQEYRKKMEQMLCGEIQKAPNEQKPFFKAVLGMYSGMSVKENQGKTVLDQPLHAGIRELYHNQVADKSNISRAVQCKSGTDRTGIAIGQHVAQNLFKQKTGRDFDPMTPQRENGQEHSDWHLFRELFTQTIIEFASSTTTQTRGEHGLKWGKNPVAPLFMDQRYVDGVASTGYTQQLKPEFKSTLVAHGSAKGKKMEARANQEFTTENVKDIRSHLQKVLYPDSNFRADSGMGAAYNIIDDKLQLDMHVTRFSEEQISKLKQHKQQLMDKLHLSNTAELDIAREIAPEQQPAIPDSELENVEGELENNIELVEVSEDMQRKAVDQEDIPLNRQKETERKQDLLELNTVLRMLRRHEGWVSSQELKKQENRLFSL